MSDPGGVLGFSVVTVWEVALKTARGRPGLAVSPARLRRRLLEPGYREVSITGEHTVEIAALPPLHKDPFNVDAAEARYGAPVVLVA